MPRTPVLPVEPHRYKDKQTQKPKQKQRHSSEVLLICVFDLDCQATLELNAHEIPEFMGPHSLGGNSSQPASQPVACSQDQKMKGSDRN